MDEKLTILIPTRNRPDFLRRTLKFYSLCKVRYEFIVGDASQGLYAKETEDICQVFNCKYIYLPDESIATTIQKLNEMVCTPYVALLPDDDLLMPNAVFQIINFLDDDHGYIAANGHAAIYMLKEKGAYGKIRDLGDYKQGEVLGTTAWTRFDEFFPERYFVLLFAIHRTFAWKKMWMHAGESHEPGLNAEIIPSCISAALGRTKKLDFFYLLRQEHINRGLVKVGEELIKDPEFEPSVWTFIRTLSRYVPEPLAMSKMNKYISIVKNKTLPKQEQKASFPLLGLLKIAYLNTKRQISLPKLRNKNHYDFKHFRIFESVLRKGSEC